MPYPTDLFVDSRSVKVLICEQQEVADLLGVSWEQAGKWIYGRYFITIRVVDAFGNCWGFRAFYDDVCWVLQSMNYYTTWTVEQILLDRYEQRGPRVQYEKVVQLF